MGGESFTDFTWTKSNGTLSIAADKIEGPLAITVTGVGKAVTITFNVNGANDADPVAPPANDTSKKYGETFGDIASTAYAGTKDEAVCTGWALSATGEKITSSTVIDSESVTLYAVYGE